MDIRVEHEDNGMEVRAEVCGIERGTSLQRVTHALRAVREGMTEPNVEDAEKAEDAEKTEVQPLPAGWHNEVDTQRIKALESHVVGLQVRAESDAKLIKQQTDQIKALQDALHAG